jgi:hypothetical protein
VQQEQERAEDRKRSAAGRFDTRPFQQSSNHQENQDAGYCMDQDIEDME